MIFFIRKNRRVFVVEEKNLTETLESTYNFLVESSSSSSKASSSESSDAPSTTSIPDSSSTVSKSTTVPFSSETISEASVKPPTNSWPSTTSSSRIDNADDIIEATDDVKKDKNAQGSENKETTETTLKSEFFKDPLNPQPEVKWVKVQ